MKKKSLVKLFVLMVFVLSLTTQQASANSLANKEFNFEPGEVWVDVDGYFLFGDVSAEIKNGRTQVPIRFISETLDFSVDWNESTKEVTISKDGRDVKMTIGKDIAYVNGKEIKIDNALYIKNGRTMVPLRFIAEALNCEVDWLPEMRTAQISTGYLKADKFNVIYFDSNGMHKIGMNIDIEFTKNKKMSLVDIYYWTEDMNERRKAYYEFGCNEQDDICITAELKEIFRRIVNDSDTMWEHIAEYKEDAAEAWPFDLDNSVDLENLSDEQLRTMVNYTTRVLNLQFKLTDAHRNTFYYDNSCPQFLKSFKEIVIPALEKKENIKNKIVVSMDKFQNYYYLNNEYEYRSFFSEKEKGAYDKFEDENGINFSELYIGRVRKSDLGISAPYTEADLQTLANYLLDFSLIPDGVRYNGRGMTTSYIYKFEDIGEYIRFYVVKLHCGYVTRREDSEH